MAKQLKPRPLQLDLQPLQRLEYSNDIQLREKSQAPNSTIEYFAVAKDTKAGDTKIIVVGYDKNIIISKGTTAPTITAGETGKKEEKNKQTKRPKIKGFDCYIIKNKEIYKTSFDTYGTFPKCDIFNNLFCMYYDDTAIFIDIVSCQKGEENFGNKISTVTIDTKDERTVIIDFVPTTDKEPEIITDFIKSRDIAVVLHKPYKEFCKELCKQEMCKNICNTTLRIAGDTDKEPEYYAYIYNKEGKRFLKYGNINDLMQEVAEPVKDPKPVEVVEPVGGAGQGGGAGKGGVASGFMPLYDQYVLFQV